MTDYNEILDTQIDQDSAITEDLMTQMRDNPIAIAEGAAGAPRVQGVALGGRSLGAFSLGISIWENINAPIGVSAVSVIGVEGGIQFGYSTDGGSNWTNISEVSGIQSVYTGYFDFEAGEYAVYAASYSSDIGGSTYTGAFTPWPSNVTDIRVRGGSSSAFRGHIKIEAGFS